MAKRKSVSAQEKVAIISHLMNAALEHARDGGSQPVIDGISDLAVLDQPRVEQVASVIGLIDGVIELNRRFGKAAQADRQAVADQDGDEEGEVCETKAVAYKHQALDANLTRARLNLDAAQILLRTTETPIGPADMVPIPTPMVGNPDSNPQGRPGRYA